MSLFFDFIMPSFCEVLLQPQKFDIDCNTSINIL